MTDNLIGDRYVMGPLLGRGGMAEVRRARDTRLERDVAVKRLKPDLAGDPIFQERFRREAHAAAGLNHPNIVSVFDTGEALDTPTGLQVPYIVMELVTGHTLREILHDGRKIQPVKALELTQAVLDALDYSHRHGIIHRDIKPANVMLTTNNQVKVMDFGIARAVSDTAASMTQTASVIGTPQYLSPEQIRGDTVDRRSDVYSTGCLLYELLTGKPPFEGDSPVSLAYQHVRATPVPPSEIDPMVSAQMDAVVLKALAKNPADRYQTAHDMHEDIARLLAGQKVQAVIPPPVIDEPTFVVGAADHTQVLAPAAASKLPARAMEEPEDEPQSHLGRLILIILAIVLAIALATVGLIWALNREPTIPPVTTPVTNPVATVVVPSVETMHQDGAVAALTRVGLVADVQYYYGPDDTTVGTVTSQNPAEGTTVNVGDKVTIKINQGSQKFEVPDVKTLTTADAKVKMAEAGFTNVTEQPAKAEGPDDKAGTILSTDPVAGAKVPKTQPIILYYATGQVKLPNVVTFTRDAAIIRLGQMGFTSDHIKTVEEESTQPEGTVIKMDPPPETVVAKDTDITLTIAKPVPQTGHTTPSGTGTKT